MPISSEHYPALDCGAERPIVWALAKNRDPATLSVFLEKLGFFPFAGTRTVWVVADTVAELESAGPLFENFRERLARIDLAVSARHDGELGALAAALPKCFAVPLPWPIGPVVFKLLLRLNTRMLVFLGLPGARDRVLLQQARKRMLPVVVLDPQLFGVLPQDGPAAGVALCAEDPQLLSIDHFYLAEAGLAPALAAAGIDPARITNIPAAQDEPERLSFLAERLRSYLARDLKLLRGQARPLRRGFERCLLNAMAQPWMRPLTGLKFERIGSLQDLGRELGHPKTILCLGNGPSSEDPQLLGLPHDALFRVNHRWRERGFLAEPQVVFTGSKDSVSSLSKVIFGFLSVESEGRMRNFWLFLPNLRRLRYLTVERFDLFLRQGQWREMRPTNGASMLTTAVALQPRRLVVSGFDLFSHPEGSYPGDTATPNAYSPGHDPNRELDALLHALSLYRGELVILSSALAQAWADYSDKRQQQTAARLPGS